MITEKQLKKRKRIALVRLIILIFGIIITSTIIIKVILKWYNSPAILIFGIIVIWAVIIKVIKNYYKFW